MDEAEKLCNRIAFVDKGRLVSLDTLDNLKRLIPSGDIIEIGCDEVTEPLLDAIRALKNVISVEAQNQKVLIRAGNSTRLMPLIYDTFRDHTYPMTSIAIRSPSLEDVFIYLTGRNLGGGTTEADDRAPARGRFS